MADAGEMTMTRQGTAQHELGSINTEEYLWITSKALSLSTFGPTEHFSSTRNAVSNSTPDRTPTQVVRIGTATPSR